MGNKCRSGKTPKASLPAGRHQLGTVCRRCLCRQEQSSDPEAGALGQVRLPVSHRKTRLDRRVGSVGGATHACVPYV